MNNDRVYAFNLFADDQRSFYIYLNNIACFQKTLEQYRARNPEHYNQFEHANSLKYNMGDFDFQFWPEHMGVHGKAIEQFEKIAERSYDVEQFSSDDDVGKITIAIEAGIVRAGYQCWH